MADVNFSKDINQTDYLVFFLEPGPTKSQKECDTILTPSDVFGAFVVFGVFDVLDVFDVDDVDDAELLQPLAIDDWPRVPVSLARPLSWKQQQQEMVRRLLT